MTRLREVVKTFKKRVKQSKNLLFKNKEVKLFGMEKEQFWKILKSFLWEDPHLHKLIIYAGHSDEGNIWLNTKKSKSG